MQNENNKKKFTMNRKKKYFSWRSEMKMQEKKTTRNFHALK